LKLLIENVHNDKQKERSQIKMFSIKMMKDGYDRNVQIIKVLLLLWCFFQTEISDHFVLSNLMESLKKLC